ncbi:MAG TPA: class I SAM-dependent methyltransferase [Steroidobacteraceae bacterium]|nr:class I SAM-dependent methyltransferase [Steroidobacteraceae bacterium]
MGMSAAGLAALNPSGFEDLAEQYDSDFTRTAVGMALRRIVWARLERIFRPAQRILELGCGTGEDAVRLALAGIDVVATDASPAMLAIAREKARRAGCLARIDFQCIPMESVGRALHEERFDGVFSNFGALNCVRDLSALSADLSHLLPADGTLVWVVMGRRVPWEWLWYLLRADRRRAFRRYRRRGVEWRGLTIHYPTPAQVTALLAPRFAVTRVAPLGIALPPSYAADWFNRSPRALAALTRLEELAQRSTALASWSDHYVLEARRSGTAGG